MSGADHKSKQKVVWRVDWPYACFNCLFVAAFVYAAHCFFHMPESDNPLYYIFFGLGSASTGVIRDLWLSYCRKRSGEPDQVTLEEKPGEGKTAVELDGKPQSPEALNAKIAAVKKKIEKLKSSGP